MSTLFELNAVGVHYGKVQALKACGLRIQAGERVALVGSNGSGKSTLLRTLHGLVRPSTGSLQVDGAARQAMLFQHPYMLRASAQTNVALGLWLKGVVWKEAKTQALRALERVGLLALAQRNAKALSGGQQQRLALARAWALRPDVLLLDEPTASLDPAAKRDVEALMAEFAQAGMTLIFSSHNLGQVKRLASRVMYLEQGRLLADLPTHDFFNGPLPAEAEIFVKGELV
ncbi:MAG: phosphate ABC transporter ATP-binding protein [Haliea sp.]|nr:MAG: phosphate ABC transporter ATP-binding protein [Haliea sp.]